MILACELSNHSNDDVDDKTYIQVLKLSFSFYQVGRSAGRNYLGGYVVPIFGITEVWNF